MVAWIAYGSLDWVIVNNFAIVHQNHLGVSV